MTSINLKLLDEVVDEMPLEISNNNSIKVDLDHIREKILRLLFLANALITTAAMDQMMPDFQSMSLKP